MTAFLAYCMKNQLTNYLLKVQKRETYKKKLDFFNGFECLER